MKNMIKNIIHYVVLVIGYTTLTFGSGNIVFIHGLNSGSSTWDPMIKAITGEKSFIRVGAQIEIDDEAKCWDGYILDEEIECRKLTDVNDQPEFRSIEEADINRSSERHIFGLKKESFKVTQVDWEKGDDNMSITDKSKYKNKRVFSINFTNKHQLSFGAQGYQLKKMIDDIASITKVDNFILIGHSMGGLAARAYIQNEDTKIIKKLITLNTPHLGGILGGIYSGFTKNAGVNLSEESEDLARLNELSNIEGKYTGISVYHLGYSDGLEDANGIDYYNDHDGQVRIYSQMGLDALNPYRVIFSPEVEDDTKAYAINSDYFVDNSAVGDNELNYADEVILVKNYNAIFANDDNAHSLILKDQEYIDYVSKLTDQPKRVSRHKALKIILDAFSISSKNAGFNNDLFGNRINTPNDVSNNTSNYDYIVTAYNRGIVSDKTFRPNDNITFLEFLTMITKTIPIPINNPSYEAYLGNSNIYIKAAFNAKLINLVASYDFDSFISDDLANDILTKAVLYFQGPSSGISIYAKWTQKYVDVDLYLFSYEDDKDGLTIEKDSETKVISNMTELRLSDGIIYWGEHSKDWGGNLDYDSWGGNNQPWIGSGEERITVDSQMIRRPGKYAIILCYYDGWNYLSNPSNPSNVEISWWGINKGNNINKGGLNFSTKVSKGQCKHGGSLTTR